MKKQYKSSIIINHKIKEKIFLMVLKDYVPLKLFLDFWARIKKDIVGISSD